MSAMKLTKRSIAGGLIAAAIGIPATAQARFDHNPVFFPQPAAPACHIAKPRGHVRMDTWFAGAPAGPVAATPHRGKRRAGRCSAAS